MCSGRREASRQSLFEGGGKQSSHVDSICVGVSRQCEVLTDVEEGSYAPELVCLVCGAGSEVLVTRIAGNRYWHASRLNAGRVKRLSL